MHQPSDLFCLTIFFVKFNMCNSLQILREYIPPHDFPVEQEHSGPGKVWRYLFLKVFHGRLGKIYGRDLEGGRGGGCSTWGIKDKGWESFTNTFFSNHSSFFQSRSDIHLKIKP